MTIKGTHLFVLYILLNIIGFTALAYAGVSTPQQAAGRYTLLSHDVVNYKTLDGGTQDDGQIDVLHDDQLNTTIYVHYWVNGYGSVMEGNVVIIPDWQLKAPETPVYYIQTNPNITGRVNATATKVICIQT